jgi:hypothetical protein
MRFMLLAQMLPELVATLWVHDSAMAIGTRHFRKTFVVLLM